MEILVQTATLLEDVQILTYRAYHYISFRNTAIQRWAKSQTAGDEYYTLLGTFWRKATGEKKLPDNAVKLTGGHTLYFRTQGEAETIARKFLDALKDKDII